MLLQAHSLVGGYGEMRILQGVSLEVDARQLAVIVGPNGAGKSTALRAIFGLLRLESGRIEFEGRTLVGLAPYQVVAQGLAMVPQDRNVFASLSVMENLQTGACQRSDDYSTSLARVFEFFPDLASRRRTPGGELSGGQRQMLAMGRALMSEPRALLLDEPTAGLSPAVVEQVLERILAIRDAGMAVLMVEQNARQALSIADTGFVLANGANGFTGSGAELLADARVRASFLGG